MWASKCLYHRVAETQFVHRCNKSSNLSFAHTYSDPSTDTSGARINTGTMASGPDGLMLYFSQYLRTFIRTVLHNQVQDNTRVFNITQQSLVSFKMDNATAEQQCISQCTKIYIWVKKKNRRVMVRARLLWARHSCSYNYNATAKHFRKEHYKSKCKFTRSEMLLLRGEKHLMFKQNY